MDRLAVEDFFYGLRDGDTKQDEKELSEPDTCSKIRSSVRRTHFERNAVTTDKRLEEDEHFVCESLYKRQTEVAAFEC